MFKITNEDTRKISLGRFGVFIINLRTISNISLVFLLSTFNR